MSAEPGHKSAYPADLRWRVIGNVCNGTLVQKDCSESQHLVQYTAQTTFKLFEQTGEVSPWGQPSRKEMRYQLWALVLENPSYRNSC